MRTLTRRRLRDVALVGLAAVSFTLCGSGPPDEGAEVGLGVGGGRYDHDYTAYDCDGNPLYSYRESRAYQAVYAYVRARVNQRVVVTLDGAGAVARTTRVVGDQRAEPGDLPPVGDEGVSGYLALRFGYVGDRGGFELGPALVWDRDGRVLEAVVPSLDMWIGDRRYFWCALMASSANVAPAGFVSGGPIPFAFGAGWREEDLRAELGTYLIGYTASADVRLGGPVWIGAGGHLRISSDEGEATATWAALMRLTFDFPRDAPLPEPEDVAPDEEWRIPR